MKYLLKLWEEDKAKRIYQFLRLILALTQALINLSYIIGCKG